MWRKALVLLNTWNALFWLPQAHTSVELLSNLHSVGAVSWMKTLLLFDSWKSIFDYYTINIRIIYFNRSHYSCLDYNHFVVFAFCTKFGLIMHQYSRNPCRKTCFYKNFEAEIQSFNPIWPGGGRIPPPHTFSFIRFSVFAECLWDLASLTYYHTAIKL